MIITNLIFKQCGILLTTFIEDDRYKNTAGGEDVCPWQYLEVVVGVVVRTAS